MEGKERGRKWPWPYGSLYRGIWPKELRKTTKTLRIVSITGRYLNQGLGRRETGVLLTQQLLSVNF